MNWEIILLVIIIVLEAIGLGIALYLHYRDSSQQESFRDEELEILNQIADALNEPEEEVVEHHVD